MSLNIDGLNHHKHSANKGTVATATPTATTTAPTAAKSKTPILHFAQNTNPNPTSGVNPTQPKAPTKKLWKDVQKDYAKKNALPTDEARVRDWLKEHSGQNTLIINKKNATATVLSADGKVVEISEKDAKEKDFAVFEVGLGDMLGDGVREKVSVTLENGETITDDATRTPAGIYTVKEQGEGIFTLETEKGSQDISIQQIPDNAAMYDGKPENNRFTDGNVGLVAADFSQLSKVIKPGTKVYILPEQPNNEIVVRNERLALTQKKYTGNVYTSPKPTACYSIEVDASKKPEPRPPKNQSFLQKAKSTIKDVEKTALNFGVKHLYDVDESMHQKLAKPLAEKKCELMQKLDVDNDAYNDMAYAALGIFGQESDYGQSPMYVLKAHYQEYISKVKDFIGDKSYNSDGPSQMKIKAYKDKDVIRLFQEYGITPDNIGEPEKASIGTMIMLADIYKNQLPALKPKMKANKLTTVDALLYIWKGDKSKINNLTATPGNNGYLQNAKFYADGFKLKQFMPQEGN